MRTHWYVTVAKRPDQVGGGQVFATLGQARSHIRRAVRNAARDGRRVEEPAEIVVASSLDDALRIATKP